MVDIIKFLPTVPTSFRSDHHRVQHRSSSEQITLPIFLTTVNNLYQNDRRASISNTKRWIGRCLGDPARHLNISDATYSIHRKAMHRELAGYWPTSTTDTSASSKIKQQQKNSDKDLMKPPIGIGTTVAYFPSLSGVDVQNFRLFDALSKHVTIKSEPLRPVNNYVNNAATTLTSWQKYWSSTQTQRRRKEATNSEAVFCRPQPLVATTHFVTVRDSSFCTHSRTPSSVLSSCSVSKVCSPTISEKQPSSIKKEEEDDNYSFLPELFFSPRGKTPPMNSLKPSEEKPASPIKSDRLIIKDDAVDDNQINTITTKIYKLPLPSNKPKVKKAISKRGSREKSLEKKPFIAQRPSEKKETKASFSKRTRQTPTNQTSSNKPHRKSTKKQQPQLSSVMTTTPRSKYEHGRWDAPYVGVRFDPPTPPCSPSLFIWPENAD